MNCQEATVLIVDDDEVLRQVVVYELNKKFIKTMQARNGIEALGIIKTCKVHVVISDIQMPDGDGIQLLKAIRERDPETPTFFFLTGSNIAPEAAISMGARGVFTKPFNREDLVGAVLKSLGSRKGSNER